MARPVNVILNPIVVELNANPIAIKGDKGDSFSSDIFIQATPSSVWTYNHNKGYYPSVFVLDLFNRVVNVEIIHSSINQITIIFNIPYTGKIIIN